VQNVIGILIGIALSMQIAFGSMAMLKMLIYQSMSKEGLSIL
jgi:hypothetical protein